MSARFGPHGTVRLSRLCSRSAAASASSRCVLAADRGYLVLDANSRVVACSALQDFMETKRRLLGCRAAQL